MVKKLLKTDGGFLGVIIITIVIIFSIIEPNFFTMVQLVNIVRAGMTTMVFALGLHIVIVAGGIDLSFMAIATFSSFCPIVLMVQRGGDLPVPILFLIGAALGFLIGMINGFIVGKTKIPAMITTLGMQGLLKGFILFFFGTSPLYSLPSHISHTSKTYILTAYNSSTGVSVGLNVLIVYVVILCLTISFMMNQTKFGRSIFAIGGDEISAKRVGINVSVCTLLVFALAGAIAGTGGVMQSVLNNVASPTDLIGNELLVIASVIVGGANLAGGRASISGTVLGVLLITIINNSLTILGVDTYAQQAVLGVVILVIAVIQYLRKKKGFGIKREELQG